jgi:hypothetical protein
MIAASSLPPLYAEWIDAALDGGAVPEEGNATCDDCAMCASEATPPDAEYFDRDTKCCTYVPELFNFLVGRVLADEPADDAARIGRASVEERIRRGVEVTPLGLGRPRPYLMMYRGSLDAFGHARTMKCPHFVDEGGRCGVWRHRMSMCATWYCKHERGAVGMHFWRSVERLLSRVERALSTHCVNALDPGRDALEQLFRVHEGSQADPPLRADEIDGRANARDRERVWGRWAGREEEFFRACAELVRPMKWPDVRALGGPEVAVAERLLRDAHRDLASDAVPEVVQLGPFQVLASDAESMRVATYSSFDPLVLPRALADLLHRFDGRRVDDVLETIASGDGVELDKALVRKLLDFKILV